MRLALNFPNIDPVIFSIDLFGLELALRWYALAYVVGLLLGWRFVLAICQRPRLWSGQPPMQPVQVDSLLTWMIFGVILGGRLGYVIFYQPGYFLAHPVEVFALWQGGMSFHGGLLGVVVAILAFAAKNGVDPVRVGDCVAAAAPIGLFFGRVANFINAELWGRPTELPWGIVFPGEAAQICPPFWEGVCARHPSQLYEAFLEGVVLFAAILVACRRGALRRRGCVIGIFLLGYGLARTIVEGFRQADAQYVTASNPWGHVVHLGSELGLTMGQVLSLPMAIIGVFLILWAGRQRA
ncbi:MAG: prolipoprotein diacylglyceryl transferase [Pseudomonadota bacterium]